MIRACVWNHFGNIRIITANQKCSRNEKELNWNIIGPPGQQGPTGPSGPPGSKGSDGLPGKGGSVFTLKGNAGTEFSCSSIAGGAGACEPERQVPMPSNGKLVSFAVNPFVNTNTVGGPAKITVLVNDTPTALEVEIPPGSMSIETVFASVDILPGDLVVIQSYNPASDGSLTYNASLEYRIE